MTQPVTWAKPTENEEAVWPCSTVAEMLAWWKALPYDATRPQGSGNSKVEAWAGFTPRQREVVREAFGLETFGPVAVVR